MALVSMYQEYLYVIGQLKDIYNLTVDVDHKDIHTFYKDKTPIFKLFFGMYTDENDPSIVVSFHIELRHIAVVQWFANIHNIHPLIKVHHSWIDDANGEAFMGEEAEAIQEVYRTQETLEHWLNNESEEDMKEFVESKIVGRQREPNKPFDSTTQQIEAVTEFNKLKKPDDDESVH